MNKQTIFGLRGMIRPQARRTKNPEGHEGGTPPADGNNTPPAGGGNLGGDQNQNSDSNNTGNDFDPATFWQGPAPAEGAAPSGESAGNEGGESGNGQQGNFATQLTERLKGLKFGDPIFDDNIAKEINEGNFGPVQQRFEAMGQQIVREALALNVQILKPFAEQLMEQVRQETSRTFNQRDDAESLVTLFPAAKNPVMAKTIQPIYDQALKNSGGNREKAVAQTKEMLRFMAGESARDLDIDIAPRGEGGASRSTPTINWLDELTSRK